LTLGEIASIIENKGDRTMKNFISSTSPSYSITIRVEIENRIGLSAPNVITADDIRKMAKDPIVFALANPEPFRSHGGCVRGGCRGRDCEEDGVGAEIVGIRGQGPGFSNSDPVSRSSNFFRLYPDPRPLIPEKRNP